MERRAERPGDRLAVVRPREIVGAELRELLHGHAGLSQIDFDLTPAGCRCSDEVKMLCREGQRPAPVGTHTDIGNGSRFVAERARPHHSHMVHTIRAIGPHRLQAPFRIEEQPGRAAGEMRAAQARAAPDHFRLRPGVRELHEIRVANRRDLFPCLQSHIVARLQRIDRFAIGSPHRIGIEGGRRGEPLRLASCGRYLPDMPSIVSRPGHVGEPAPIRRPGRLKLWQRGIRQSAGRGRGAAQGA